VPPKKEPEVSYYETIINDISDDTIVEKLKPINVINNAELFTLTPKKPEIYDRLHKEKETRELKHTDLIRKYKTREISECTFTPKINRSHSNQETNPTYIKLYEYSKEKEGRKTLLNNEKQIEFDKVYTFSPTVNNEMNAKFATESFDIRLKKYISLN
jgi:hypothetical protein